MQLFIDQEHTLGMKWIEDLRTHGATQTDIGNITKKKLNKHLLPSIGIVWNNIQGYKIHQQGRGAVAQRPLYIFLKEAKD